MNDATRAAHVWSAPRVIGHTGVFFLFARPPDFFFAERDFFFAGRPSGATHVDIMGLVRLSN